MKDLKLALDKFESAKLNLKETLKYLDTKSILTSQEELKNLKENNKILKISQTEATEKINKLLIKIEKIIGRK
ncbi:MAG: hypothetical protein CFH32_01064 [Alphaproteobacteria bacterium MarineAlpha9_Bin2]|nr:MAG: hypothetical protein CFH32_01064 [Alphaproteobacteria bacterium MarineAlpha9_Bin2]PPR29813.1 MAG: hypothetical protein CFH31_00244 [Alphaproteobacteria bacterium MarineAlpha9_Bin1]